jgi:spore maturation protein CgeB
MHVVMYYHSLLSDWNHGNAHFLRGVASELQRRGHRVTVYEPAGGWSLTNLLQDQGVAPLENFHRAYPGLSSHLVDPATHDVDAALEDADLVLVHEWNEHALVQRLGEHHRQHRRYRLLFHDTHHRAVSDRAAMARYALQDYDGVLAFGAVIRDLYLDQGWTERAWTWHEAADVHVFKPLPQITPQADLVWVGNWGDDERTQELHEFLLQPARALGLQGDIHGVRYPPQAQTAVASAGLRYRGWLANFNAPATFARHRVTVHVPRRPYVQMLPGIPTIRPFEALACGIPLVSAPWKDSEGLFQAGSDYLVAANGAAMTRQLRAVLHDSDLAQALARHGRATVLARHTCAHRVDELLAIHQQLTSDATASEVA